MEPRDLDKIFRDHIENDSSELNQEELQSRESIWEKLDINHEKDEKILSMPAKRKFNTLLRAAAVLLLLGLGGLSATLYNKLQMQNEKYQALENEYNQVGEDVANLSTQIQALDQKMSAKLSEDQLQNAAADFASVEDQQSTVVTVEKQYIEKTIYVKDTSVRSSEQPAIVQVIRDTVYIKQELEPSTIASQSKPEEINTETEVNQKPKKVEFVFGKKAIEEPKKDKIRIQFNCKDIARKGNQ